MSSTRQVMSKSVALVLSSGGARGVAHIGVIEALLESGHTITSLSGSSMGAVVAGVYAAGKLEAYKEWILNLDKLEVFKLVDFTLSTQGFIRGERVFKEMKKFIPDCNIEDLEIPLAVVATDVVNKKEVVFKQGSLYNALRASAAIPSVLKPSIVNGVELVDGGVINPIPYTHVQRKQDDLLVISDVNANIPCDTKETPPATPTRFTPLINKWQSFFPADNKSKRMSYFNLVVRSVDLMQDKISSYQIAMAQPDVVVRISRETCTTFEFYRSAELIACGKKEFKKSIANALQRN